MAKNFDDFLGLSDDELRAAISEAVEAVKDEDGTVDPVTLSSAASYRAMLKTLRAYHDWVNG